MVSSLAEGCVLGILDGLSYGLEVGCFDEMSERLIGRHMSKGVAEGYFLGILDGLSEIGCFYGMSKRLIGRHVQRGSRRIISWHIGWLIIWFRGWLMLLWNVQKAAQTECPRG
jgi:hypothetical protein